MPDEPNGQPSPEGGDAPSDDTQRLGPDLTKRVSAQPSSYDATHPWSDPVPPPAAPTQQQPYPGQGYPQPPYGQPYPQQPYQQQPYPQQPYGQPYPQQPYQQAAYGQPAGTAGYGSPAPTASGKAVAVLVLGIASLLLVWMCGVGLVTAIVALAMAPGAKREIRDSQGRFTGLGMVQGGVITSWVAIGLLVLLAGAWIIFMVAGSSVGGDLSYSGI